MEKNKELKGHPMMSALVLSIEQETQVFLRLRNCFRSVDDSKVITSFPQMSRNKLSPFVQHCIQIISHILWYF